MLKWQATLHTQENSDGLHDIHWRCELLSQEGGLDQFIVWMWKRSQSLTVDGIEAKQLSRTGVSSVYVTSESSVLCLIGRNRRWDCVASFREHLLTHSHGEQKRPVFIQTAPSTRARPVPSG